MIIFTILQNVFILLIYYVKIDLFNNVQKFRNLDDIISLIRWYFLILLNKTKTFGMSAKLFPIYIEKLDEVND